VGSGVVIFIVGLKATVEENLRGEIFGLSLEIDFLLGTAMIYGASRWFSINSSLAS